MYKGKTLLSHLESEERKKIAADREFVMPEFRAGDVMKVTMFSSISEGKYHTYKGLVYGKAKPNNLNHSMWMNCVIENTNTSIKFKLNSPMVAKVEVDTYGGNRVRKKLNHIPDLDLTEKRTHDPIIKNTRIKPRKQRHIEAEQRAKRKAASLKHEQRQQQ